MSESNIASAPESVDNKSEFLKISPVVTQDGVRHDNEALGSSVVSEISTLADNNPDVDLSAERAEIGQLQADLIVLPNDKPDQDPNFSSKFHKKSPHELAAQIGSVGSTDLKYTSIESGEELDQQYTDGKAVIEDLLSQKVSDEVLLVELERLYREGYDLGIYSPAQGPSSSENMSAEAEKMKKYGYSDEDAKIQAQEKLGKRGYLDSIRSWRRGHERDIAEKFESYNAVHPLDAEIEKSRIEELRRRTIVIDGPEKHDISENFPGGNFLYHGTGVEQAISILDSGGLMSRRAMIEKQARELSEQVDGKSKHVRNNSGYEGISWNFNEISAMPGDRYHLVGFLTSPNAVLNADTQLSIPSRPAPNELILINGGIDADKFYSVKSQQELISAFGMGGETNSILNNLISLSIAKESESEGKKAYQEPLLRKFSESDLTDDQMADLLRSKYSVGADGIIEFSPDLLQQVTKDIPVAAVWFQALTDTGKISEIPGLENSKTVREIINSFDVNSTKLMTPALRALENSVEAGVQAEDEKVGEISVPVSDLYVVVPDTDLEKWLKILARTETPPKGILVFNHNNVRLENFASNHKGDDEAMTGEIRKVVPEADGLIDFEGELLGEEITPEKLAGYKRHVIAEQYLKNRKSLKKDSSGSLVIA